MLQEFNLPCISLSDKT